MENIDRLKVAYFIDELKGYHLSDDRAKVLNSFVVWQNIYSSAAREITTKLENLNDEFKHVKDRNPIHHIKSRIKTPKSIMDKLIKRGFELSPESARDNLTDIAGVRVICSYIDDIYVIADLLTSQDDIVLIRKSDYIKNPKPNGYRSLHMIVTIPVFLSATTEIVNVEIQIRTIAMDFWASLEHELSYKLPENKIEAITLELKDCADVISNVDMRMQRLYNNTMLSENIHKE
ncbi:MAG: GTP pyrophosphokinase family protein [Salinivirgaceae bacterium]|nr:GTP pyrophosphokinase family protein [Salinivirgaceae bacterium]MDD4746972.1 GTP pyrophosphokinase family protein [Salinivirgaceae bacterium]MDY0280525.1 GTP pyrophosphokinase family protein [Salinivirgaceae bacterium]